uniref:ZM domain-containing protein n=1 Tax=Mesocestoides corti TaxID=53468 RepID=A0A5K3EKS3_MESCO
MVEILTNVCSDSQTTAPFVALVDSNHSKSLPNLHKPEIGLQQEQQAFRRRRLPKRVYSSTHRIPGSHALILSPIGSHQHGELLYAPSKGRESYITARVNINTYYSRSHEYEDLQSPHINPAADLFYDRTQPPGKKPELEVESVVTSTDTSALLPSQPHELSLTLPSVEDLSITKDDQKSDSAMTVPTQYAIEQQLNGEDEVVNVITQKPTSVSELRRKFEEARTMYLPRDPNVLYKPQILRVPRRAQQSKGMEPLRSRPRSAAFGQRDIDASSPVRRHNSQRSVSLCEPPSPVRTGNCYSRTYQHEKSRAPVTSRCDNQRCLGTNYTSQPRRINGFSPTVRRLPGIRRDTSPRSINRAAGGCDWPDGIFTKTGDVYKRVNDNGISYIIPTSPDSLPRAPSPDYRGKQLTVDCSDNYPLRTNSLPIKQKTSPNLNYSYLEHINPNEPKPYRSVTLSDWQGIPNVRKSASCFSLNGSEVFPFERHHFPRAVDDDTWKVRSKDIGGRRGWIKTSRGSWSPTSMPGDFGEITERNAKGAWRNSPKCVSLSSAREGIDDSSISRAFDSSIAYFEKLAVENRREAHCSQCPGCYECSCTYSPTSRRIVPSRRLFSTRRTRPDERYSNNCAPYNRSSNYAFEHGSYDRYYGDESTEVITPPGSRTNSRHFKPYLLP